MTRRHRAATIVMGLMALLAHAQSAHAQTWEDLQASHAVIDGVDVVVTDVFNLSDPADDTWIGHAANAVHVRTRRTVVSRELLFAAGDVVDAGRIHETERNLRRYSFVRDARISAARVEGQRVWVRVEVADAWSLNGSITFSRTGGTTAYGADLDESNLAGRGKRIALGYGRDRERSTRELAYTDPQLLDTRWTMSLRYADQSDGASRFASIEHPYYSIETPFAVGAFTSTTEYVQAEYHLGQQVFSIPTRRSSAALYGSRAMIAGHRTALRLGLAYQDQRDEFATAVIVRPDALPAPAAVDRRLRGVAGTWSLVQDRAATFENFAAIAHVEDYNLGWTVSGDAGYFARALGGSVSAPFASLSAHKGWRMPGQGLVLAGAAARGRHERDGWHEGAADASITLYHHPWIWQTVAANLQVSSTTRPDPDAWLYLDSNAGLRGYPDHFVAGDRRVVLSLDDRVITRWNLLGLVQVGFVGYGDIGAVRRFDTGRWSRTYADVGAGLRFGSLKGARGSIIQASIAFPLVRDAGMDGALLVLGNAMRF